MAGCVVHHCVVLRAAVVPDGDAVPLPPPAHLVFGDERLADEVPEQVAPAGICILAIADVRRRMEVREVGGEGVYVEDLLAGLGMGADDGMLGVRVLRL